MITSRGGYVHKNFVPNNIPREIQRVIHLMKTLILQEEPTLMDDA